MKIILKIIFTILLLIPEINAATLDKQELIVGTKVAPPFAMKSADGKWEGVSIDLWREIAKKLDLKYKFVEHDLNGLLNGVKNRELDLAVAAITVTSDREKFSDFTNSYYTTTLSILVPKEESNLFMLLMKKLFSITTLWVILGVLVTLVVAGFAFWYMERRYIKDDSTAHIDGIGAGIWWAAVTMTTVGYGDLTPKTFGGKVVAIIWMFTSMFFVSLLIAGAASFFTVSKMNYFINTPEDLAKGRVASIKGSFSDAYLRDRRIYPVYYKTISQAIEGVKNKEVDAFVYDEALIKYLISSNYRNSVRLTESRFQPQDYSIELQEGSNLREKINRALMEILESRDWEDIKHKYSVKPKEPKSK